jgi:hypothetical protein
MKAKSIQYAGRKYAVPKDYQAFGYTHGVFGTHQIRGPAWLRWLKGDLADTPTKQQLAIAGIFRLYCGSMTNVQVLPIEPTPPERGDTAVRNAA